MMLYVKLETALFCDLIPTDISNSFSKSELDTNELTHSDLKFVEITTIIHVHAYGNHIFSRLSICVI